jgi:murein DD-endopeptidase MepM/ murein hydrolase activator NlpD
MIDRRVPVAWPLLLPALAVLMASLACARSDIPVTEVVAEINPTQTVAPTQAPPTSVTPPITPTQPPTAIPTVTVTPATPEAPASPTPPATPTASSNNQPDTIVYDAQPGDTLRAVAVRFGVLVSDISASGSTLPDENSLIAPDTILLVPRRLGPTGPSDLLIPDSEMVFSPHAVDFDVSAFAQEQGGFLANYHEYVGQRWRAGPDVLAIAARDNSVNPRLLLALLEYKSHWVTDPTRPTGDAFDYPLGHIDPQFRGLYQQLSWLSNELGKGYYDWRAGRLTELVFKDTSIVRLAPELDAGTVALQYYFSETLTPRAWAQALSPDGFIATYKKLFGDPWQYFHPLFEPGLKQPSMILPFLPGHVWAFTGGPHGAWERESAWAALDFAPSTSVAGCAVSEDWAVASAPGLVVRSGGGVVVLDLDGDGREQTGWDLIYLHIANQGRVEKGTFVEQGDLIGHPSCEGGIATGTHLHLVRKYNGEWILADGPLPFDLSGWVAHAGTKPYQGELVKDGQTVLACPCASRQTLISR